SATVPELRFAAVRPTEAQRDGASIYRILACCGRPLTPDPSPRKRGVGSECVLGSDVGRIQPRQAAQLRRRK
ncbi:MAG: hypothetical protein ACF788_07665, partial [Novipirellula sp. JB048]